MHTPFQFTDEQLALIYPTLPRAKRKLYLPALNCSLLEFGIDTPVRAAAYAANLGHESTDLTVWAENLNYRADQLLKTFHKYFNSSNVAAYARNPVKIANRVYANRMGNGTEESGDGWRNRGAGPIQTTGANNIARVGRALKLPLSENPDMLRQPDVYGPEAGLRAAAFFWADNRLNKLADLLTGEWNHSEQKTFTAICKVINGGTNGLDDRIKRYKRALHVLETRPAPAAVVSAQKTFAGKLSITPPAEPPAPPKQSLTPDAPAAATAAPAVSEMNAEDRQKATSSIDSAVESLSPATIKRGALSVGARMGGRLASLWAWIEGMLRAGNVGVWLVVLVAVAGLVFAAWFYRKEIARVFHVVMQKASTALNETA